MKLEKYWKSISLFVYILVGYYGLHLVSAFVSLINGMDTVKGTDLIIYVIENLCTVGNIVCFGGAIFILFLMIKQRNNQSLLIFQCLMLGAILFSFIDRILGIVIIKGIGLGTVIGICESLLWWGFIFAAITTFVVKSKMIEEWYNNDRAYANKGLLKISFLGYEKENVYIPTGAQQPQSQPVIAPQTMYQTPEQMPQNQYQMPPQQANGYNYQGDPQVYNNAEIPSAQYQPQQYSSGAEQAMPAQGAQQYPPMQGQQYNQ